MMIRGEVMHTFRAFVSSRLNAAFLAIGLSMSFVPALAQESVPASPALQERYDDPSLEQSAPQARRLALPTAEDRSRKLKNAALILGEAAAVGWYGKRKWWVDGFRNDFVKVNEGWFGQNTYAGGTDKAGHFFTNYTGARLLTKAFAHLGNDPDQALFLGAALTLGTMTAVEVIDGYAKRWSFSREDAIMNVLGTTAGVLMEKYPRLDDLVDIRFAYSRSTVDGASFDPLGDYSGQTYIMVLKASGFPALREHPLLRYVELAAGYGARNYSPARPDLFDQRKRLVYFGISLNLSELLNRTVFKNSPNGTGRAFANTALEYVQVPGTAVFRSHQLPTR
jgi:hypothetical protein